MRELATFNAVWRSALPASSRLLLVRMAQLANGTEGRCTAAVATLVRETGLARGTVRSSLVELQESGWLVVLRSATNKDPTEYGVRIPRGSIGDPLEGQSETPKPSRGSICDPLEGQLEGQSATPIGEIGSEEQQPGAREENIRVSGAPELTPVDYDTVGHLLAAEQDATGRLQPHRDSQAAVELALRQGRSPQWLGALLALAKAKSVKALSFSWLLGPSQFATELRTVVDVEQEAHERRRRALHLDQPKGKPTMEEREERARAILAERRTDQEREAAK